MPDISIGVAVVVFLVVGLCLWRPEAAVLTLGIFLFVQSAVVRLDGIAPDIRQAISRTDDLVLLALTARIAAPLLRQRRLISPPELWPLVGLSAIGVLSAVMNGVPAPMAAIGLFLTVKAGMWLFVFRHLRYNEQVVARYLVLVGALFTVTVLVAVIQVAGYTMPWELHLRRSDELAATSIWNQHTVFGTAMAVAAGLAVVGMRLPGLRRYGLVLAAAAAVGVFLSTVRRLILSLPLAALAAIRTLPDADRRAIRSRLTVLRRPASMGIMIVALAAGSILIGPRLANTAANTWDEYVIHAAQRDRYQLMAGAFELVVDSPLVGRGPGTYGSFASVLFDSPAYDEVGVHLRDALKYGAPYGSLLGEYGLLGGFAFLLFVWLVARVLLGLSRTDDTLAAALATGGLFMLADMTIESVVHPTFTDSFVAFFAFGGIGAAIALNSRESRTVRESSTPRLSVTGRWAAGSVGISIALMATLIGGLAILNPRYPRAVAGDVRPNIVLVMLDDLDVGSMQRLPNLVSQIGGEGVIFTNAFTTTPLDGPARVSLFTGQATHTHGIWTNYPPEGGYQAVQAAGLEPMTIGPLLAQSGYHTALVGTYLPNYGRGRDADFAVPPGWDDWFAVWGLPAYSNYRLNENGRIRGHRTEGDYLTDTIAKIAHKIIDDSVEDPRPLFLTLTPLAPSRGAEPAPRHQSLFGAVRLPRTPAFVADLSGKPPWLASRPPLDAGSVAYVEAKYRDRLRSMLAVQDLVTGLIEALQTAGKLEDTYIFFVSGNGYHLGTRGLLPGRRLPYDEDLRVPLMVRGPGIAPGTEVDAMVSGMDIAPTLAQIAGIATSSMDGMSFLPLLRGDIVTWREGLEFEYEQAPDEIRPGYRGIRTSRYKYIAWEDGYRELYDLVADPYEIVNVIAEHPAEAQLLDAWMERLAACEGPTCLEAGRN